MTMITNLIKKTIKEFKEFSISIISAILNQKKKFQDFSINIKLGMEKLKTSWINMDYIENTHYFICSLIYHSFELYKYPFFRNLSFKIYMPLLFLDNCLGLVFFLLLGAPKELRYRYPILQPVISYFLDILMINYLAIIHFLDINLYIIQIFYYSIIFQIEFIIKLYFFLLEFLNFFFKIHLEVLNIFIRSHLEILEIFMYVHIEILNYFVPISILKKNKTKIIESLVLISLAIFGFFIFEFIFSYVPAYIKNPEVLYSCLPFWKLLILPLIAIIHISFIKKTNYINLKIWGLIWSLIIFTYMYVMPYYFEYCSYAFFNKKMLFPFHTFFLYNKKLIIYGADIMSMIFLLLTAIIFIIVFYYLTQSEIVDLKKMIITLYFLYFCLIHVFTAQNLLFFFYFFESSVIPMFLIIMMGGSRFQKTKAAYYFFFFTVAGSMFMYIGINYISLVFNDLNINNLIFKTQDLEFEIQCLLWLSFFLSFAVKIPMFPFHTWLPEAHVEAPTVGSVLLAGILLKLGIYGCIRILFFLFPEANVYFSSYVYILALISIILSCLIALRQTDIKRIIAYASIAHMNVMVIGLYSFTPMGIYGAIFQCVSHGLVSSALFILIGILYDRHKTRLLSYYGGLAQTMPIYSTFFLFFTLANISFPLTSNFIGELLIFVGVSKLKLGLIILTLFSVILNTIYSLWFCNRLLYGNVKSHLLLGFKDLTLTEIIVLSSLALLVLILGIFPNILLDILPCNYTYSMEYYSLTLSLMHEIYVD